MLEILVGPNQEHHQVRSDRKALQASEESPKIPVRFLSGVLGAPIEEITSDVIHHQKNVCNTYYEKYIAFRGPNYEDWVRPKMKTTRMRNLRMRYLRAWNLLTVKSYDDLVFS
jgi:hypothetical protein